MGDPTESFLCFFDCWLIFIKENVHGVSVLNPLPVQFKSPLPGQEGYVFFSGHLNLRTTPETGLPSREKKS